MTDSQNYGVQYNTYPIHASDDSFEPALKRFSPMPTPDDVYKKALMGLPKVWPLTNEPITVADVEPYLNTAINEIEMEMGMNISPVDHWHSEDSIPDMFTSNYTGIRLQRWPATHVIKVQIKYPHTNIQNPYQVYTIPPGWVLLRSNRINIVASYGTVFPVVDQTQLADLGGVFSVVTGFSRAGWVPGQIEVVYTAGFPNDKLPSIVADLLTTWAAYRFLQERLALLFPFTNTDGRIDSIGQGVSYNIALLITGRLGELEKKRNELVATIRKSFGKTIRFSSVGS